MKNAVNNWYMSQEPLALAKCVTKYKGRFGWKHKDIIKLSHTLGNTPGKCTVHKIVIYEEAQVRLPFTEERKINYACYNLYKFLSFGLQSRSRIILYRVLAAEGYL